MIIKWLWRLIVFGLCLMAIAGSLAAVAGLAAYVWPSLDVFNHAQLLLLPLTLLGLLVGLAVLRRQPARGFMVSLAATGFLASVAITAPEITAALMAQSAAPTERPVMRLMSFNIFGNNRQLSRVPEPVKAANPDILLIQEYWHNFRPVLDGPLGEMFPYTIHCQGGRRAFIALFSRIPFEIAPGHACVDDIARGERVARISVRMADPDGRTFTVMTTHLDWPYPPARQMLEMAELTQAVGTVPGPFILAGDFNSTPFSLTLRGFSRQNGLERQTVLLPTWPVDFVRSVPFDLPGFLPRDLPPFLPLDHVMTRGGIAVVNVERAPSAGGSDHYPVIVDFYVASED